MRAALLLVLLCGCDTLFGLHEIEDAQPIAVQGTIIDRWMNLDASFAPQFETVAWGAQPIEVFHEDGTRIDVSWEADSGAFTFTASGSETYRVVVEAGTVPIEYQATSAHLSLAANELGAPGRRSPSRSSGSWPARI